MNGSYIDSSLSSEERADDLLSRMTLEEKIGQLQCYSAIHSAGKSVQEAFPHGVGQVSSLIATMLPTKEAVAAMVRGLQEEIMNASKHRIPALFHIEALTGTLITEATSFPSGIGQASTWNPALQKQMGAIVGKQTRAVGFRQVLAPVLDISRDSRFGRQGETYGEDPTLSSAMGVAYVKGVQNDGQLTNGVAATAKHFLAFQAGEGGIHSARTAVPERELREVYAKPFQAAIKEADLQAVMNSYASINGEAVIGSKNIQTKLLREELGFTGVTVSDYGSIGQLHTVHKVSETKEDAGQRAIEAGMDVELPINECYTQDFAERVKAGLLEEDIIDRAVRRTLIEKFKLGLFEDPFPFGEDAMKAAFDKKTADETSLQMARESCVLLKNNGVLPLQQVSKKIAVIGYHLNSVRSLFGGYSYMAMKESSVGVQVTMAGIEVEDGSPSSADSSTRQCYSGSIVNVEDYRVDQLVRDAYPGITSVLEELESAYPDVEIAYAYGYPYVGDDESGFEEALAVARDADVVLMSIGGRYGWNTASTTGEGIDSTQIGLPQCQEQFISRVAKLNKPMIAVHFDGRPVSSDAVDEHLDAVVEAWTPGEHGAKAIMEVLQGTYNPSGKLPVSVARNAGQIPVYYAHENGSSYDAAPSAGFNRYLDGERTPRYHFGYGLSYTTFEMKIVGVNRTNFHPLEKVALDVAVSNTGDRQGSEVVQLYVTDTMASMVRPVKELIGFQKIALEPRETKTITFEFQLSQLAFLDEGMQWKVEAGDIRLSVGRASDRPESEIRVTIMEDAYVQGAERGFFATTVVK